MRTRRPLHPDHVNTIARPAEKGRFRAAHGGLAVLSSAFAPAAHASAAQGEGGLTAVGTWLLAGGTLLALALLVFGATWLMSWLVYRKGAPLWAFLRSVMASVRQAVAANQDVQRLVNRHPRVFDFLKERLKRGEFTGWPATLLGMAFLYVLLLFLGSIEDFITADAIVAADVRIANLLFSFRSPSVTGILLWITLLGKAQVVFAATSAVSVILFLRERKNFIAALWISVLGGFLFTQLGKLAFHRPRPPVALYLETTWSFPSGHASIAIALYGFLTYLLWRQARTWRSKILVLSSGITLAAAIGFSRLYLGVHYLSDVWSGYLLGMLWLIIGVSTAEALEARRPGGTPPPSAGSPLARAAVPAVLLAATAFFVVTGLGYDPPKVLPPKTPLEVVKGDILLAFRSEGLPRYSETLTGIFQEPMSFIILARDGEHLVQAFSSAGWSLASRKGLDALMRAARAALLNTSDPTAPMTPSLWNGKPHDFGFQKPLPGVGLRQRHHARFWRTQFLDPGGGRYYVGTASLDVGMKWMITHRISPDLDTEREFLYQDLYRAGQVRSRRKVISVPPTLGRNFAGDPFFTDGKLYVLELTDTR